MKNSISFWSLVILCLAIPCLIPLCSQIRREEEKKKEKDAELARREEAADLKRRYEATVGIPRMVPGNETFVQITATTEIYPRMHIYGPPEISAEGRTVFEDVGTVVEIDKEKVVVDPTPRVYPNKPFKAEDFSLSLKPKPSYLLRTIVRENLNQYFVEAPARTGHRVISERLALEAGKLGAGDAARLYLKEARVWLDKGVGSPRLSMASRGAMEFAFELYAQGAKLWAKRKHGADPHTRKPDVPESAVDQLGLSIGLWNSGEEFLALEVFKPIVEIEPDLIDREKVQGLDFPQWVLQSLDAMKMAVEK